jgi:hypothetical protein
MSLTITDPGPGFVRVDRPDLTSKHWQLGWRQYPNGTVMNDHTRWRVGAVIVWHTLGEHKDVQWVATGPSGTSGTFDTWQEAVNFADITGALE